VADADGIIRYAFANADYTRRAASSRVAVRCGAPGSGAPARACRPRT
jgi:hypothetical protein